MKKLKLVFATLLAALFAFTGGKALAYDITVENGGSGTYESYQIFTGTLSEDGTTLSNIEWGNGITTAGQTALQEKYGVSSAAELAEVLGAEDFTASQAEEFAKAAGQYLQNAGGLTGLAAGYYLVQNATVGDNEAYTNYILQVVNDVTVEPKTDVPTVEKKVKDTNDTTGETTDWQDSADYDINDSVPFQLTATLPSNLDSYDEYYLELSDTLSSGLTYNKDAKVYLVNGSDKTDVTSSFTIADDGSSFKINNLKSLDGVTSSTKVVVEYTATLNENAVIGSEGNPNTVKLIYSNNPNYTGDGETSPHGETPEDTVIVFTYKVVVNKVKEDGTTALPGAGFTLYKKDSSGNWNEVETISAGDTTTFTFSGLDDGDYKLEETTTPNGYNTIDPVEFTVTAGHDVTSDSPALNSLSGDVTTGELTFTSSTTDGSLTTDVVNKKGSVLPSTGGMGTTILYVVGTILVLAAGILLVTKKRMDAK
ncbi:isopeptide-forming domain-containing fimbrial protein [Streptococcus gallolyticus]|uniref:isopeptide-forming domain-containing fimbrial protein n=1 Tax=Streptococcus gallolyticus TaxID=315405 RepID=UPI000888853C|nr:isopeptide-forming domain-containing fimbrial protein [Streptococcus gallolyticus]SDK24284.1 LPXTG-motif cell wall anchor domain-containing protein/fimbrial isopeptide formation D2 domain-containing protein [Streptococcus gallolyticus]SDL71777.1 LPXTG-motif cell wall anchor domain-containing protein/fimbrial isopeptide formation D2 domain-containing protein [Streptococcus gallolyticus]